MGDGEGREDASGRIGGGRAWLPRLRVQGREKGRLAPQEAEAPDSAKEGPQNWGSAQQGNTPPSPYTARSPRSPSPHRPARTRPPSPCSARGSREGARAGARSRARRGIQARYKARSPGRPRRRAQSHSHERTAACMAPARHPTGARLLLLYAGLLAAAAGLGSPEPGAPSRSRAREEPPPGNELPRGPGESRAGLAAHPPRGGQDRAHPESGSNDRLRGSGGLVDAALGPAGRC
ncbi:hypothetical protein P7K49_013334 [Saguinus oedipus]|uniref:Uncharacterized protein n=1 Tax=Saguinus oedipus TaxID=9490 RepID=A0ABQ9VFN1_SAGOE|nr:hypothetical protein P7K49_013334 [Saguinus oedipus]